MASSKKSPITKDRLLELIERAKANIAISKNEAEKAAAANLQAQVLNAPPAITIDLSKAGITAESIKTDVGENAAVEVIQDVISNISASSNPANSGTRQRILGVARDDITLNVFQQKASDLIVNGQDIVLIGAAGTGKTTSMRATTKRLVSSNRIKDIDNSTKYLVQGKPGCAILSYTRKAVNNIRHAVADEFKAHTLTIHKLLEFEPVFYQIEDPNNAGEFKHTMAFEPKRNAENPLPSTLTCLIYEESSMIAVELYEQLQLAMPHKHQEVFLGDIQQLPPIFGLAVLGFKMLELPVVELTEVYRQALESPIISLAWKLLEGNPHAFSGRKEEFSEFSSFLGKEVTRIRCPALDKFTRKTDQGQVKFQIWQKRLSPDLACNTFIKQITAWEDQDYFDAENDIILCPFNKSFGTIEINKGISQHLGKKRRATVYEVIAGFNKHYLAVGDRVLYDKEDAVITAINKNGQYLGKKPMTPSVLLDRWGAEQEPENEEDKSLVLTSEEADEMDLASVEKFLENLDLSNEERVQAASHAVHIRFSHSDEEMELDAASEINNLLGGYAITIHKAQGSEYDNVFLALHDCHIKMCSRELLYTAVTRAKKFLHIICETNTFEKGIKSQRIKGNSIAQKAEFFKGEASKRDIELRVLDKLHPVST